MAASYPIVESSSERLRRDAAPARTPAQQTRRRSLTLWKKVAFAGSMTIAVLVGLELVLWACGVQPAYHRSDPYAGFTPQVPHFVIASDERGQDLVTVAPNKRESLNEQSFPRRKPPGTYRIVCVGGSATYGRPFFDHTSFAGWLRAFFPKADQARKWEVINAGAISYASYRVKGVMAELAQFEPDLFIAYMGNNEFLEQRTYAGVIDTPSLLRDAAGLASRTRLASVSQSAFEFVGILPPPSAEKTNGVGEEVTRRAVYAVGPEAYSRDESFKRQVLAHYEASLYAMVDIASAANARLLFVTELSNLRDFAPFKSENRPGLSPEQLRAWQAAYQRGRDFVKSGKFEDAVKAFDKAASIDDRHADLMFRKGQALLALGRDQDASASFVRAREEDICPLRAQTATRDVMHRVASARGVPLLDFDVLAASRAEHKIPGDDLLADHVHLKIPASRMLALDILGELVSEKIVTLTPGWGPDSIEKITAEVEAGIDGPRYAHELYTLSRLFDSLGQPEQALKRVEEGIKMSGGDVEGFCLAALYQEKMGQIEAAISRFQQALAIQPGAPQAEEGLGVLLLNQGETQAAIGHLERAAQAAPESPSVCNRLGVAYAKLGRFDLAVRQLTRASQLQPNDAPIRTNLGLAEERRGNRREAIVHYGEALRINPEFSEARMGLNRLTSNPARPKQP
jgi:tetratricopeptide (TPR) repeat protein